jgi:hypothetical protein
MSLLPVLASSSISARNVNGARWFCGIDLGTTNSLVAVVCTLALRSRDYSSAVRGLPAGGPPSDMTTCLKKIYPFLEGLEIAADGSGLKVRCLIRRLLRMKLASA